ncbi:MAG: hypothetical protein AAF934_00035 [Bacteroidota bacterium]
MMRLPDRATVLRRCAACKEGEKVQQKPLLADVIPWVRMQTAGKFGASESLRPATESAEPVSQDAEMPMPVDRVPEMVNESSVQQPVPEETTTTAMPVMEGEASASEAASESVENTAPEAVAKQGVGVPVESAFNTSGTTPVTTARPAAAKTTSVSPGASENLSEVSSATAPEGIGTPVSASPAAGGALQPAALSMNGSSDEALQHFTNASASQIAASFPVLGASTTARLNAEQKTTAETTVAASAQMSGPDNPTVEASPPVVNPTPVTLGDGITENEPPPVTLPDITANGSEINTSAGERPVIDTRGSANPNRTTAQRNESQAIAVGQSVQMVAQIQAHPGQQNIQPLRLEETVTPSIPESTGITVDTPPQQEMAHFAAMPLPAAVRQRADERMAPLLEPALARSRQEISNAAAQRDAERERAIAENRTAADRLNAQAQNAQQDVVREARGTIAQQQQESMQQVQQQTDDFNTSVSAEEAAVSRAVQDRIQASESQASSVLRDAEARAETALQEGEVRAEQERKDAEQGGILGGITDLVSRVAEGLSNVIGAIFEGIRDLVTRIITAAKEHALSLIESGRQWVVDRLGSFGRWAVDMVNNFIKAFAELQRQLNSFIETAVEEALSVLRDFAEELKADIAALADELSNAINSAMNTFQTAIQAATGVMQALLAGDFAEAARIAFYAICDIAGIDPNPVLDFINRAGETISIIFNDPGAFFNNVANGVGQGINQFMTNIRQHLLNGLVSWLMGTLSEAGITLPERFDLQGIFSLVMEILGLTYANIRAKIVDALGPRGETIINAIEETVDFIWDFIERGPVALWDRVRDMLSNLKDTVMSGIQDWVVTNVIQGGITWLLSLLNPASALIRAAMMVYDVVMFFVDRWQQIATFVQSIFDSVGELARGNLSGAADAVENAMGRSVPVIISFLASLLGLGGISQAIRNTIERIRRPVDNAIDRVIAWIVDQGRQLLQMGRAAVESGVEAILGWWKAKEEFTAHDGKKHELFFSEEQDSSVLMVASQDPKTYIDFIRSLEIEANNREAINAKTNAEAKAEEIDEESKRHIIGTNEKEKDEDREKKKETIERLLSELAPFVAVLMGVKPEELPETSVNYGTTTRDGSLFALRTEAKELSKEGEPGSRPRETNPVYEALFLRKKGNGIYYVRGHMLNDNIHGPGVLENLTPLSIKGNKNHLEEAEKTVKIAVNSGALVRYIISATYGRAVSIPDDQELQRLGIDSAEWETIKKIREAERNVPENLEVEADVLKRDSEGEWVKDQVLVSGKKIDNPIDTDLRSYQTGEGTANRSLHIRSSSIAELATAIGMDRDILTVIQNAARSTSGTIHNIGQITRALPYASGYIAAKDRFYQRAITKISDMSREEVKLN